MHRQNNASNITHENQVAYCIYAIILLVIAPSKLSNAISVSVKLYSSTAHSLLTCLMHLRVFY